MRSLWLTALLACAHEDPFRAGTYVPDGPFSPGVVTRLTFNAGTDRTPAWLADGSGLLYSFERIDRPDRDRCLGQLPAQGGSLQRTVCTTAVANEDSVDIAEWPAVSPDGRFVYVVASGIGVPVRGLAPARQAIVLGSLVRPQDVRVVLPVGYTVPGGRTHDGVSNVQWLDTTRLVLLGESVDYVRPCLTCLTRDTLRVGIEIIILGLSGVVPTIVPVPGTSGASSVAVATRDTVVFTVNGDSRVFGTAVAGGSPVVVHDFGAGLIARDVRVADSLLVAVVGGRVSFAYDSVLGKFLQRDDGGILVAVNLVTGAETAVPVPSGPTLFRHPALSRDGRRLIAEGYPLTITVRNIAPPGNPPFFVTDTTVDRRADLWLF